MAAQASALALAPAGLRVGLGAGRQDPGITAAYVLCYDCLFRHLFSSKCSPVKHHALPVDICLCPCCLVALTPDPTPPETRPMIAYMVLPRPCVPLARRAVA